MSTTRTRRFVDRWALFGLAVPLLALVVMLVAGAFERVVLDQQLTASTAREWTSDPVTLDAPLGATSVVLEADLPSSNAWAAVQLAVLDDDGETLVEVVKEAWAETGTWYEDGESGVWAESDQQGVFDFKGDGQPVRFEVSLLEAARTAAPSDDGSEPAALDTTDAAAPSELAVHLVVRDGTVDLRWLLLGAGIALALALLALYAGAHGGRPVVIAQAPDSEVQGRAECGGLGRLVKIVVGGLSDETTPAEVTVRLKVRDADGDLVVATDQRVTVSYRKDDGEIEDARYAATFHIELAQRSSYGFAVEVVPDGPVENIKLVVRDGATTRGAIDLLQVAAARESAA